MWDTDVIFRNIMEAIGTGGIGIIGIDGLGGAGKSTI